MGVFPHPADAAAEGGAPDPLSRLEASMAVAYHLPIALALPRKDEPIVKGRYGSVMPVTPANGFTFIAQVKPGAADDDTRFMDVGIFDTDFDKYVEDAVTLFKATGIATLFDQFEGHSTTSRARS